MSHFTGWKVFSRRTKNLVNALFFVLIISLISLILGSSLSFSLSSPHPLTPSSPSLLTASDPIPSRYQVGQDLYLETCSGCHIPIPPGVLPTETWRRILEKPTDHYGESISDLISISQLVIWDYLNTFSRPLAPDEPRPIYIVQSRYFKALHPRVTLPKPLTHQTCITCHPGAEQFDYQSLTPEWENAP